MIRNIRYMLAAALIAGPGLIALAQVSIAPPPSAPATSTAPATEPPHMPPATATAPASTLPTAQSVLQDLLNNKQSTVPPQPEVVPATTNPALTPVVEAVAPNEPKATRIREGQVIWNRTGRLVKDEKTGTYIFEFDADGKGMADPPMGLLPSHLLMAMEDASDKGTKPVKFKVTGEVTEYRGKNYLHVRVMQAIQDLNQGIGG